MPAKKQKPQPAGPKALRGSAEAKRKAAIILEVLSGLRSTQSAADEIGVALVRYYVLETRMLQAMISELEPKPRGRQVSVSREREKLQEELARTQRELSRLQALHRVTQRAVGVQEPAKRSKKVKAGKEIKTRRTRKQSRGERIVRVLNEAPEDNAGHDPVSNPAMKPVPDSRSGKESAHVERTPEHRQ
jgi:Skp family chaperone for outer membrane proteins